MGFLLKYLKEYKKESILGPLFKLLEASFELMVPLVMAKVIDVGIANHDTGYIVRMCLIMVLLGVVGLASSLTAQYFAAKAAVGCTTGIRQGLFSHIAGLAYSDLDMLGTSALITRMTNDLNQVQSGINMALRLFLRSPFIVAGAMIMAFTINVKAALVFVVVIPLLSIIVFGVMAVTIPLYKKVQNALGEVLSLTRENCTGVRVIRAFTKEEEEMEAFYEENLFLSGLQKKVGSISALMNPGTYIIINLGIVALIYTGAVQVYGGIITQGEVVALVNYMSQILVELIKFANCIVLVTKALASAGRVESVFGVRASMEEGEGAQGDHSGSIEFKQVGLKYPGCGEDVLTDVSFGAKRGEVVGVIGSTGSGKSSLVQLIPRFYEATQGEILVDGVDVKAYRMEELRKLVGMVPQHAVLFSGTIRDNLLWGNEDATDEELWEALRIAQAKEIVMGKEDGLDTYITAGGGNLSGGQKQRLTIARALVRRPEFLILDDSASALDFATEAKLREGIQELRGETTVFMVSQRISSIKHSDRIVVLDDGKVAAVDSHDNLLRDCQVYQEIYHSQVKSQEGGASA